MSAKSKTSKSPSSSKKEKVSKGKSGKGKGAQKAASKKTGKSSLASRAKGKERAKAPKPSKSPKQSSKRPSLSKPSKKGKKKEEEIKIDVFGHFLTPRMEIMKKEEVEKLLEELNAELHQLPKMLVSDPAAVALKAKVGDVIKIYRKDPTGEYLYYRVVVEE